MLNLRKNFFYSSFQEKLNILNSFFIMIQTGNIDFSRLKPILFELKVPFQTKNFGNLAQVFLVDILPKSF